MPGLVAGGHEVWLALPAGRFNDPDSYLRLHPWEPCVRLENPTGSALGRRRAVCRALRRIRPDVLVVAQVAPAYEAVAWLRSCAKTTPRVVSFLHSLSATMFEDLRCFASGIDGVAGPNRLVPAIAVAGGFVEPERAFYLPGAAEVRRELDPTRAGSRVELVYAGRFENDQKRVRELPDLLRRLARRGVDWSLDAAGVGPETEWLEGELAQSEFAGRVRFHGALRPEEVGAKLLRPGRVLLILSNWELGPAIAWEALGQGLAVVTSEFVGSGLENALRDGETCLKFPIGDLERASAAIERLVSVEERHRLASAAWTEAGKRYSRAVVVAAWNLALEKLVALPKRAVTGRPRAISPAGRLDRWLGVEIADVVRRICARRARVEGPGDEWPHALSSGASEAEFLRFAARVDRSSLPSWLGAERELAATPS
jgi:glycosyltransferase involved in cell wall biosynthesis